MKNEIKNEALEQMLPKQDPADKRKSGYSKTIKTVDDLLKNIELRNRCKRVLGFGYDDLTPEQFYKYEAEERDEEIVRLLEDLGVLKADWTGFQKQPLGRRKIIIAVDNNSVINFFDRLNGKNTKISNITLRFVAHQLADNRDAVDFFELLESCGIPKSLFQYDETYPIDNEWLIAYDILKLYSSSAKQKDLDTVFRIMEKTARPIMFGGDEKKSLEFINKLDVYLQHDGYCFGKDGKIIKNSGDKHNNSAAQKENDAKPAVILSYNKI